MPKKVGGLGQFPDLRGGAWQMGGGIFEGGVWYPNAHYVLGNEHNEVESSDIEDYHWIGKPDKILKNDYSLCKLKILQKRIIK